MSALMEAASSVDRDVGRSSPTQHVILYVVSWETYVVLTEFLEAGRQMQRTAWLRRVRTWARQGTK